jgi:hypothetical protein
MMLLERLGALGLLAVVLLYIFKSWLPRRDKEFTEAIATQQATFERLLCKEYAVYKSGLEVLAARQRKSSENIAVLIEKAEAGVATLRDNNHVLGGIRSDQKKHFDYEEPILKRIDEKLPK